MIVLISRGIRILFEEHIYRKEFLLHHTVIVQIPKGITEHQTVIVQIAKGITISSEGIDLISNIKWPLYL